jgi:hypothetical protein
VNQKALDLGSELMSIVVEDLSVVVVEPEGRKKYRKNPSQKLENSETRFLVLSILQQ